MKVSRFIAPRADDALHLLSLFGRGGQSKTDDTTHSRLALHRAVVDELGDRLHLPSLAFRFIGSFYHVSAQREIVRMGGIILLQQFREPLCRSFLRLLELFQRVQHAFLPAELTHQLVQLIRHGRHKFECRFVGRELTPLAHLLERRVFLALCNVLQDRCVEFARRRRERRLVIAPGHQGIEGLEYVPRQCGKGFQLFPRALLDFVHGDILCAQVMIDIVLQLGRAKHAVSPFHTVCLRLLRPRRSQNILNGPIRLQHGLSSSFSLKVLIHAKRISPALFRS